METKPLPARQIDTFAQRLSETPIEPANPRLQEAGGNLARLLKARIGGERAALAFISILSVATFEQAEARLTLVLDYGNTETAADTIPAVAQEPEVCDCLGHWQTPSQPRSGADRCHSAGTGFL